jgi:hypothetical protein
VFRNRLTKAITVVHQLHLSRLTELAIIDVLFIRVEMQRR